MRRIAIDTAATQENTRACPADVVLTRFSWSHPCQPCQLGWDGFVRFIDMLKSLCPDPSVGFFGPSSIAWLVNREYALYLGGLRALLMQVAHPKVAEGVARHSRFTKDPFGRALNTFVAVQRIIFGTAEEACEVAREVYAKHLRVRGSMPDDAPPELQGEYDATDPELTRWVHATLIESAAFVFHRAVEPLGPMALERLYHEGKLFALFFGITPDYLPADWSDFSGWFARQLAWPYWFATRSSRRVAAALLGDIWWGRPLAPVLRCWAACTLPEQLARPLGLRMTRGHRVRGETILNLVRQTLPLLPDRLRYTPYYHRAIRRAGEVGGWGTHKAGRDW